MSVLQVLLGSPIDMELASSSGDEDHCSSIAAHLKKKKMKWRERGGGGRVRRNDQGRGGRERRRERTTVLS